MQNPDKNPNHIEREHKELKDLIVRQVYPMLCRMELLKYACEKFVRDEDLERV